MLRWMDGFEHYGANEAHLLEGVGGSAAWSDNTWTLSTSNPATGAYHMRVSSQINFGQPMRRALGQTVDTAGVGYRFELDALPDTEGSAFMTLAEYRDVLNNQQFAIRVGTEGSVRALGAGLDHRSDPCIAAGGYHHFEAKGKVHASTGFVEVRINEVTVLNVTGVDSHATGAAEVSQFRWGMYPVVTDTVSTSMNLDDAFAWDTDASDPENTVIDFIGDKGCYYLPVNADTAEADWLLSTGVTGYELLDELTPNDADYIYDNTGVARSIFGVAPLPANVAEVIAMMPVMRARKEESGSVTIRAGVVVGASESYTPDNSPSTAFAYMTPGPKTIDPDTGVAWTNSADPSLLIERTV